MYNPPKVNYSAKARPSKTVPDQSMSIEEIVRRFVRGIPANVVQRDGVFVDQSEYDLERMSRMDFAEKAAFAADLKDLADSMKEELRSRSERAQAEAREQSATTPGNPGKSEKAGIGSLDNTMPVDTKLGSSQLGSK